MTTTTAAATWTITDTHMQANGWSRITETTTATYTGRGEFFTGLYAGTEVTVERTTYFRPDGSLSSEHHAASRGGAWLAVYDPSTLGL